MTLQQPKSIGLLGGSFDPIHVAHIALARAALDALSFDVVELIPAADPWQRPPLAASGQQRLDMLKLAIADEPGLAVNPVEIERGGPTYTIDTLRGLPDNARYTWLLGADQLRNFCTWHDWQDIVARVDLAVAARPGSAAVAPPALQTRLNELGRSLRQLPFTPIPISASEIRQRLANGDSISGMGPDAAIAYIRAHRLYQPD